MVDRFFSLKCLDYEFAHWMPAREHEGTERDTEGVGQDMS